MVRVAVVLAALSCVYAQQEVPAGDSKSRIKAIKELAKQGQESIGRIQPYLTDGDTDVRREAVKQIAELSGPRCLEPLIQATRDNDAEVQIHAVDGLVNFYSPGYLKSGISASVKRMGTALKGKFTDTNDLVIDPYIQVRPDVVDALAKLVQGGASDASRANAAHALGILRGKGAEDALIGALRSKHDELMYQSLIALQKIRDPEVAPRIVFLLRDPTEKIQIAALETTGLLQNKAAASSVRDVVERPPSQKVRRAALSALAMLPDEANRKLYESYLNDKDDQLRAAAAEGFARLKNPADLPTIKKLFDSEAKMNPRLSLAFAAVSLGDNGLAEFSPLQYLVNQLNSKAYKGVSEAFLVELTRDLGIRRTLYPVLKTGTKDEKIELARILAKTGDKETVANLEPLATDPDGEVSSEGLRALRNLKARL
jgi:HEAT repeat protein